MNALTFGAPLGPKTKRPGINVHGGLAQRPLLEYSVSTFAGTSLKGRGRTHESNIVGPKRTIPRLSSHDVKHLRDLDTYRERPLMQLPRYVDYWGMPVF